MDLESSLPLKVGAVLTLNLSGQLWIFSSQILKTPKNEDAVISMSSLFCCCSMLLVKKFFLISRLNFPNCIVRFAPC